MKAPERSPGLAAHQEERRLSARLGWVLILVLLALRLPFLADGLFIGDSPELAGAAAELGVAHPPGYPLLMLTGHLRLAGCTLAGLSPDAAFNTLSLVFSLFAALLVLRSLEELRMGYRTALLGALAFGCGMLVVEQALTFEVHALQQLLLALALWAATRCLPGSRTAERNADDARPAVLLAFTLGLLFANHLSALTLAPFFLYAWLRGLLRSPRGGRTTGVALSLSAGLLGLSLYLYLPLRAGASSAYDFGMVDSAPNLLAHLSAKTYTLRQGLTAEQPGLIGAALAALFDSLPWPLWLLVPPGLYHLFRRGAGAVAALLAVLPLNLLLLRLYRIVDPLDYLLPVVLVAAVFAGAGAKQVGLWLKRRRVLRGVLWGLGASAALAAGVYWGLGAKREPAGALQRAADRDELRCPTPGAVYLAEGDDVLFGPLYATTVLDRRPDIRVLDALGNVNRGPLGPRYPTLPPQEREVLLARLAADPTEPLIIQRGIVTVNPDDGLRGDPQYGTTRLPFGADSAADRPAPWPHLSAADHPSLRDIPDGDAYLDNGQGFWERLRFRAARQLQLRSLEIAGERPRAPAALELLVRSRAVAGGSLLNEVLTNQSALRNAVWALAVGPGEVASPERIGAALARWRGYPPLREALGERAWPTLYMTLSLRSLERIVHLQPGVRSELTAARYLVLLGEPGAAGDLARGVAERHPEVAGDPLFEHQLRRLLDFIAAAPAER